MKRRSAAVPTRERILNEVERLIALKGVHGFKLRDVADRLGIRIPAIYKHYQSRDDVLIGVARRLVTRFGAQFHPAETEEPRVMLHACLNQVVEFAMRHPAYVRLALDMRYVKPAAGGSFHLTGPLAALGSRMRRVLRAGQQAGHFRSVDAADFYRIMKAALLIRLVCPDDRWLVRPPAPSQIRAIQRWLWDLASRFLAPRPRS